MPDLNQSLQGRDLGHLRIVAELWGVELKAPDTRVGFERLVPALLSSRLVKQVVEALPPEAFTALQDLIQNEGRLPLPLFTRRYGTLREMGAARRDREQPYRKSASPAEALWYRAFVARGFFDTPSGPVEFAYIPDDLLALIPIAPAPTVPALGRAATQVERAASCPASDRILDHACTFLAALRMGWESVPDFLYPPPAETLTPAALRPLLIAAGLLDAAGLPRPDPVRAFLEAPRAEALVSLARVWLASTVFNELRLIPHLRAEGEWINDPLAARQGVLGFISTLPAGSWWSLAAFTAAVRAHHPDFQRPAGDYDSWFIRDLRVQEEETFLRGFEHWDDVEGALIRYLITGPLHWLGFVDLASPPDDTPGSLSTPASAFRLSAWFAALVAEKPPAGLLVEDQSFIARSTGLLIIPRLAPRSARYLAARFCRWEEEKEGEYIYRLTPASLALARQQGLSVSHLLPLLKRYAKTPPLSLLKALERWEQHGAEAHLEQLVVLRVASPDLLQALRTSRASRFLGDPLGPTAVAVKSGAVDKVLAMLAEMGYLGEVTLPPAGFPSSSEKTE